MIDSNTYTLTVTSPTLHIAYNGGAISVRNARPWICPAWTRRMFKVTRGDPRRFRVSLSTERTQGSARLSIYGIGTESPHLDNGTGFNHPVIDGLKLFAAALNLTNATLYATIKFEEAPKATRRQQGRTKPRTKRKTTRVAAHSRLTRARAQTV